MDRGCAAPSGGRAIGMSHVFISYSHEDREVARRYASALEAAGLAVWWDDHLRSGEAFDEKIEAALRAASAVVVLWSKTSVASRWVRAEATLADRNKTLVPVMIEPCERPIMFELSHTVELGHWRGEATDKAWLGFLGDVRRLAAKEAAPPVEASANSIAAPTVQETLKLGQSGSAPSLAVLPFTNRSTLVEDDIFAEGMVEDVIAALSQGVNLRVLGATATANLSRAAITDLAAVGRQLGVRYLLEGNVRRVGANLRVTTQLLEAESRAVMWTAKFERPLSELAELQEDLVLDVASHLDVQVFGLEMRRALSKPDDITAWEALARAQAAFREYNHAAILGSVDWATRAAVIAPDYGPAQSQLADSLAQIYINGDGADPAAKERIRAIAMRAVSLSPDDPLVLMRAGVALGFVGYPEEGIHHTESAVSRAPGSGLAHYYHAVSNIILNRLDTALSHIGTAQRLMPGGHVNWAAKTMAAFALQARGEWAEAENVIDACSALNPGFAHAHVLKAISCLHLGRDGEASQHIETARRLGAQLAATIWFDSVFTARHAEGDGRTADIRSLWPATEPNS